VVPVNVLDNEQYPHGVEAYVLDVAEVVGEPPQYVHRDVL
jgi:hypothetical protein